MNECRILAGDEIPSKLIRMILRNLLMLKTVKLGSILAFSCTVDTVTNGGSLVSVHGAKAYLHLPSYLPPAAKRHPL